MDRVIGPYGVPRELGRVRPDGSPVLLDFGIARDKDAGRTARTGQLLGTPACKAPEQAAGERPATLGPRTGR